MSRRNRLFTARKQIALISICFFILLPVAKTNAATVAPGAYMAAGNIGDTWTYANLDSTQFTWTLSLVTAGPNAGRLKRGNDSTGIVYDVANNAMTWYEYDNQPINPPFAFSEFYETGQPAPDPLGDNPRISIVFLTAPSITVPAGTYNDILLMVWLDGNYAANTVNISLGLDPAITAGVTDVEWYARGVGLLRFMGVDAATGGGDGIGYELVNTTVAPVPVPAAVWLFGSGLLGLIGIARRRGFSRLG